MGTCGCKKHALVDLDTPGPRVPPGKNQATILKIVWSDGRNNWHHDFNITSPPSGGEILVVHVSSESMNDLLEADHTVE